MARKSTKKSEEKAETKAKAEKKTTTKKTATKKSEETKKTAKTKQNDNVKLTFRPVFSAATNFTAYLQKKVKRVNNGNEIMVDVPIIEGLPGILTVKAGEIITVTQAQLDKLIELGFVESEDQVADRKAIEKGLAPQHPERLSYDIMATNRDFNIKPRELEKIYTDKLIIVD
jgi:hypothetical protein